MNVATYLKKKIQIFINVYNCNINNKTAISKAKYIYTCITRP